MQIHVLSMMTQQGITQETSCDVSWALSKFFFLFIFIANFFLKMNHSFLNAYHLFRQQRPKARWQQGDNRRCNSEIMPKRRCTSLGHLFSIFRFFFLSHFFIFITNYLFLDTMLITSTTTSTSTFTTNTSQQWTATATWQRQRVRGGAQGWGAWDADVSQASDMFSFFINFTLLINVYRATTMTRQPNTTRCHHQQTKWHHHHQKRPKRH